MLPPAPTLQARRRHRAKKAQAGRFPLENRSNSARATSKEAKYEHRTRAAIKRTPLKNKHRVRKLKNGMTSFVPSPSEKRAREWEVEAKTTEPESNCDDDFVTPQCGPQNFTALALMKSMVQTWIARFSESLTTKNRARDTGDYGSGDIQMTERGKKATRPKISIEAKQALQMKIEGTGSRSSGDFIAVSSIQVSPTQLSRLPPGQYTVNNIDTFISTIEEIQGLEPGSSIERKKHNVVNQMKEAIAAKRRLSKEGVTPTNSPNFSSHSGRVKKVAHRRLAGASGRKTTPVSRRQSSSSRRQSISGTDSPNTSAQIEDLFQDFFPDKNIAKSATTEADLQEIFPSLPVVDASAVQDAFQTTVTAAAPPAPGHAAAVPPPPPFAMSVPAASGGPPPPPPMAFGGMAPPPPPPMMMPGAPGSARKRGIGKDTGPRLRKLHWEPLQQNYEVEGTVWAKAEQLTGQIAPALGSTEGESDHLQRLHALFGEQRNPDGSTPKKRMRRKSHRAGGSTADMDRGTKKCGEEVDTKKACGILDSQRLQNIAIGLYPFKKQGGVQFIVSTLKTMDPCAFSLRQVEGLRDALLPDAKEAAAATQYLSCLGGDFSVDKYASRIQAPELFALAVVSISSYRMRVDALHSRHTLEDHVANIKAQLQVVHDACCELQNSEPLHGLLRTILAVGNALNRGTAKGQARGFSIETLVKVANTKAVDGSATTLLDYIAQIFTDSTEIAQGENFALTKQIPSVEMAKRVDISFAASQARQLSTRVAELRQVVSILAEETKCVTGTPKMGSRARTSQKTGINGSPFVDAQSAAEEPPVESWADYTARMEAEVNDCRAKYEQVVSKSREFLVFFGVNKRANGNGSVVCADLS